MNSQAVYAAFRQYNISTAEDVKAYLTKYDLANLLEYDMYYSVNVEQAQQQELCWYVFVGLLAALCQSFRCIV